MLPLPVILVTGFLGSGKTTFLRRYAQARPERRLAFLVNEFASVGVDDVRLAADGAPAHAVLGGSLFCECKSAEFLRVIREHLLPAHAENPFEAMIIETSGIADPQGIGTLLAQHGLDEHLRLQAVVTIVAPSSFLRLVDNLPVIRAQIETSDHTIINKTDLADEAAVRETERQIRAINPNTHVHRATYCDLDLDLAPRPAPQPDIPLSTCDGNPFSTLVLTSPAPLQHTAFVAWLEDLPPALLRLKGHATTDRGAWHVEHTVDHQSLTPAGDHHTPASRLIAIVHDDQEALLDTVRDTFSRLPRLGPTPTSSART